MAENATSSLAVVDLRAYRAGTAEERRAVLDPFFVHPRPSVLIDPIVAQRDTRHFDPITAGDFLTERLNAIRAPKQGERR